MQLQAFREVGGRNVEVIGVLPVAFSTIAVAGCAVMDKELFSKSLLRTEIILLSFLPEHIHQRIFQSSLRPSIAFRHQQTRGKNKSR